MSSPLSLLRKTKRTPLQEPFREHRDKKEVPFRGNQLPELRAGHADDVESSVLHPPLTSHSLDRHASSGKAKAHSRKDAALEDIQLMSALTKRLCLLEETVRSQAQELQSKDKRLKAMEEKLRFQKQQESTHDKRCQRLQNQVCQMESFLNDYGLIWVGDGQGGGSAETKLSPDVERGPKQPDTSADWNFHMNFDLVLRRINELNVLAGEGESFVQSTITGAQLAKKNPIHLSLYSNGIVMFDGPFRSYQEHSTRQYMQDLMDGYFPAELQERFPDGVPFQVYDRRDEEFILRSPWNKFPGEGRIVGGRKHETDVKLCVNQFLNKLPKVAPQAVGATDSLRPVLQGSTSGQSNESVVPIATAAIQTMKQRLQPNCPASAHDVINLKVKSEDGSQTFTLKMYLSETIGQLRQYVDKHRGGSLAAYDIISAHPQCCYHDDTQTLRSCGLITNGTLLLQKKKQPQLVQ